MTVLNDKSLQTTSIPPGVTTTVQNKANTSGFILYIVLNIVVIAFLIFIIRIIYNYINKKNN